MFKMAFRNLSRNKKRSILTITALIIGISFSTLMLAWLNGAGEMIIEEGKRISGDIRITALDFETKEKSLDVSSNISYSQVKNFLNENNIEGEILARIKFGSLVFYEDKDEKALGIGIEKEDYDIIGFDKFIVEGRFLQGKDEIILGTKLKEKLKLELGEEVTVLSTTQHKSAYALNYKIVGFYSMDNENLNRTFYINLEDAMYHLDMEDRVTEYLIFLKNKRNLNAYMERLKKNNEILVKPWNQIGLNSLLSGVLPIMKFIFIMAFAILAGVGITNTMMMVVYERRFEIGVLKSQGFRNRKIMKLFLLEGFIMGIIGSSLGTITGGSVAYYFSKRGIDLGGVVNNLGNNVNIKSIIYMDFSFGIIFYPLMAGILISILTTFIAIRPELKLEAVKNLRGE